MATESDVFVSSPGPSRSHITAWPIPEHSDTFLGADSSYENMRSPLVSWYVWQNGPADSLPDDRSRDLVAKTGRVARQALAVPCLHID